MAVVVGRTVSVRGGGLVASATGVGGVESEFAVGVGRAGVGREGCWAVMIAVPVSVAVAAWGPRAAAVSGVLVAGCHGARGADATEVGGRCWQ